MKDIVPPDLGLLAPAPRVRTRWPHSGHFRVTQKTVLHVLSLREVIGPNQVAVVTGIIYVTSNFVSLNFVSLLLHSS